MERQRCIVTVVNTISETSMPFNEFVLYRFKNYKVDRQVVIVCSKSMSTSIRVPNGLDVYYVGNSVIKTLKIMKTIEKECLKKKVKMIIHLHQPRSAVFFLLSTFFKGFRSRTVLTVHSLFNAYSLKNKALSAISALLAAQVTCVSESSLANYSILVKKIKKQNVKMLRNGVDIQRIEEAISRNCNNTNEVKKLIYVARMIPIKNHEFLIRLLSKLENCKLVLIGTDDKDGSIRRMIEAEGLTDRVELVGLIPRNEVFKKLLESDIYVSTSLVEGLPISVLEAMSVGLPVVLSDIPPHREINKHNKNVITLSLEESIWIKTLNEYLNMDKRQLDAIGEACRQCARDYFSLEQMHLQFDKLYEEL